MLDFTKNPIIYVTRDIERAIGLDLNTPGYFIISNKTDFATTLAKGKNNILLIDEDKQLDTWQLLQYKTVQKYINNIQNAHLLVFKNTPQIEQTCKKFEWKLINPSAELANIVEEKISQVRWLGDLSKYLPPHEILLCKDILFKKNKPSILQFNRAHTGSGTYFIDARQTLVELQNKFPNREARITHYIAGPIFTNNNIVTENNILIGNINYQITGLELFTDRPFATIGNDWGVVHSLLNKEQIEQYKKIVNDVGKKLRKDGWKGLFGVDVVLDTSSGKLFLIEINARQPASTTYESELQKTLGLRHETSSTTFEAHLNSLLDLPINGLTKIKDGAQIILRITKSTPSITPKNVQQLTGLGLNAIQYDNTKPDSELLRIQSKHSIMDTHNKFNKLGSKITKSIIMKQSLDVSKEHLSQLALNVIDAYQNLTFNGKTVKTPYFNNRRMRVRGALRVCIGKGNPEEIKEELKILSLREKIDLREFDEEQITKFIVDHAIGIDCSGFAYHVLDAESIAQGMGSLKKHITFPLVKNPIRKVLAKIRPAENCGVSTLAHEINSIEVKLKDTKPGDMIILLNAGFRHDYNHIMIVQSIVQSKIDNQRSEITYVHSFQYPEDGKYNHGVRKERISIINPSESLLTQVWNSENMNSYKDTAQKIQIRRMKNSA